MVLSSDDRQEGLDEFHRGHNKNIRDENLRKLLENIIQEFTEIRWKVQCYQMEALP
jgi:hypothetical protein